MGSQDTLFDLVKSNIQIANEAVGAMKLSRVKAEASKSMVSALPAQQRLGLGYGSRAWCAILFMDLRGSTDRAKRLGPAATYVTMHALLPGMAYLATDSSGYVVGFRGDGLFACFGVDDTGENPVDLSKSDAVVSATRAGQAMIEGVQHVVNPLLAAFDYEGELEIGVGIDTGDVIFTKIGLADATEITAYGDAVNRASKLSNSTGYVQISDRANDLFPSSANGKVKMHHTSSGGYRVQFPSPVLTPLSGNRSQVLQEMAEP